MANQIAEFFARIFLKNEISPELDRIIDELLSLNKTIENSKHPELLVQEKARVDELTQSFIQNGGQAKELSQILTYQGAAGVSKFNTEVENLTNNSYNNFRAIGQMDRITREFASGGLNQGLNGLTMFGNTLTRLAVQEGGFTNAINGLVTAFEGPAGLILVVSAAIGIFEQFSKAENTAEKSTQDFAKMLLDTNKEIKNALNLNTTQITSMQSLIGIANDYTLTEETRAKALKEIKAQLEGVNKEEAKGLKSKEDIIAASNLYVEALKSQNLAEVTGKKINEFNIQLEKDKDLVKSSTGKGIHILELMGFSQSDVDAAKDRINKIPAEIKLLENLNKSATLQTLNNPFGITSEKKDTSAPKNEEEKSNIKLLKAKQEFYKDNIYEYKNYADLIVLEEEKLAIKKAQISKASDTEISNIHKIAIINLETNQKVLGENIAKILDKDVKEQLKIQKEKEKDLYDTQVYFAQENIKRIEDDLKVEEELANKDYEKKKVALQKAMAEIGAIMASTNNPKALDDLSKAFEKLQTTEKINDVKENNKAINDQEQEYKKFAQTLSKDVTDGLMSVFSAMRKGVDPIEAIGNAFLNIASQIAALIIEATILEGIMSSMPELKAAFSAIGTISSSIGFSGRHANGGITTGPSFGLIGEAGPEAIMPLSKLGNVVSNSFNAGSVSSSSTGATSQFVLRGQDLLISINRTQKSSALKGQNISLA
jgi:hypothetical protein